MITVFQVSHAKTKLTKTARRFLSAHGWPSRTPPDNRRTMHRLDSGTVGSGMLLW